MSFRPYDPAKDQKAVHRIWRETDWIDRASKDDAGYMDIFLSGSRVLVADINDEAECLVASCPGSMRYLGGDISVAFVTAVTTSLIARKQGLASRLTAKIVAQDAEAGLKIAALGMFEQGYYSRLGFGTGPYEHKVSFNPSQLNIAYKARIPERLGIDNFKDVHSALMHRWRGHGGVLLDPPELVHAELGMTESPFGLGYRDSSGYLTHFIWGSLKKESGPLKITALAYRSREQLIELLALIKSLGDQILVAHMMEPFHVQLQDLISEPFRRQSTTRGSRFAESNTAEAYWQIRINDLPGCLAQTHLPGRPTLSFNLSLIDPIEKYLAADQNWRGVAGEYTIHLGEQSEAQIGHRSGLPELVASVNGFSRLWLGCACANAIAIAGELEGPEDLLDQLEQCLSIPLPKPGWDF